MAASCLGLPLPDLLSDKGVELLATGGRRCSQRRSTAELQGLHPPTPDC